MGIDDGCTDDSSRFGAYLYLGSGRTAFQCLARAACDKSRSPRDGAHRLSALYRFGTAHGAGLYGLSRADALGRDISDQPGRIKHHAARRSEEHTSELQSLMRISYAVFCLK